MKKILNGNFEKEEELIRESGSSVIDYIIGNNRVIGEIKIIREENRTESDHIPLEMEKIGPQMIKRSGKKTVKEIERNDYGMR